MRDSAIRAVSRGLARAALVMGAAALSAQAPAPARPDQTSQRPPFRTEANFVRVDVYPTHAGRPLTDLARDDFELLEDGRPQTIDTFEFVRIAHAGPRSPRSEPNTIEAMRQAAADPRSRIFVLFLDGHNVTADAAKNISRALVRFIERLLGPEDLIGIMTPTMSPADVVLARKTEVIESGLREAWWGTRFTGHEDQRESMYKACYRVLKQESEQGKIVSDLARVLTVRRREVLTLEALRDLVAYLRGVREERKAILVVSEGWALFRPDPQITRLREECTCPGGRPRRDLQDCNGCKPWPPGNPWKEPVPGGEPIRVGPDGKFRLGSVDTAFGDISLTECNADRIRLASIDNAQFIRDLMNDANRANASFYTIDPRGLAVFDTPLSRDPDELGLPLNVIDDQQSLRRRQEAMADLAVGTDGIALMNTNNLDAGLQRITDDLSSYYLLGYYSSNGKLDGRYRSITVRVKRPGVDVRARRGYRAPTEAEVASARALASAHEPPAPVSALAAAFGTLARLRPDARFRIHAAAAATSDSQSIASVWIAGELPSGLQGWSRGGTATLDVSGGGASTSAQVTLEPGERAFLTSMAIPKPVPVIDVKVRLTNADPTVTPFTDRIRVDLTPGLPQPLLYRRGPSTANRLQPAADFQFSRTERVRVEVALDRGMTPGSARLLDKAGQELKVPVTVGERTDQANQRWLTADVTLAALGAGDYAIELNASGPGAQQKILTAIRVTR